MNEPAGHRGRWRGCARAILISAAILLGAPAAIGEPPPGESVDELRAIAAQLNPEIAAAALAADAAQSRIVPAGALPDPMFESELRDIEGSRASDGVVPERMNRVDYRIAQVFPLWGKRGLRHAAARAEADAARQRARSVRIELDARVKTLFARHWAAHETIDTMREILRAYEPLADAAARGYVHGAGERLDAIEVEVERSRLQADLARREAARRRAAAALNGALNRPHAAPLARPLQLRPLPTQEALDFEVLIERAHAINPDISAERAEIEAADNGVRLAERDWYPDPGVRLSLLQTNPRNGSVRFEGYEAMLFFEIPLQRDVRRAQEREAAADLAASRARLATAEARLRAELGEALATLTAAREAARILANATVPQAEAAYATALGGYRAGGVSLSAVLQAEQAVRRVRLEQLDDFVEQQTALAEIERLIGGDL